MVRAGVDYKVAREISGHRSASVFERYNITDDEDVREAILKTQEYVAALPTERTVLPLKAGEQKARP